MLNKGSRGARPAAPLNPADIEQLAALFGAGRYAAMEQRSRTLLGPHPDSGIVWKALGAALQAQDKPALPALQKAASLLPDDAEAHRNLANALHASGQLDAALAAHRRALALRPDALGHFNLGTTLRALGHIDAALDAYRQSIALDAKLAVAHYNLACTLLDCGQAAAAVASYQRTLELLPDEAAAHDGLGMAYFTFGQHEAALSCMLRAVECAPGQAMGHCKLGMVLMTLGQHELAAGCYRRALELAPALAAAHCDLGMALAALGQFEAAADSQRQALRIAPDLAAAHFNLSAALWQLGQVEAAIASCRRALQIAPDMAEAHCHLGGMLREAGQLDAALASCLRAVALRPSLVEAQAHLAQCQRALGQLDAAAASLRRAVELRPELADTHNNLANVLQDLGQLDAAARSYQQALALRPGFVTALNNYALLQNTLGQPQAALRMVLQSLQLEASAQAKTIFVDCVTRLRFTGEDSEVRRAMVAALDEPWGRPNELAQVAADLICLGPVVQAALARGAADGLARPAAAELFGPAGLAALDADPLLHALLTATPVSDLRLERFLTQARHALLDLATAEDDAAPPSRFCAALAAQCHINEYVFAQQEDELRKVAALRARVEAALAAHQPMPAVWLLALAAYAPLSALAGADALLARDWPAALHPVLQQQLAEPAAERRLRAGLTRLTPIGDTTSLRVREQYEDNPYPRWVRAEPTRGYPHVDSYLRQQFPLAAMRPLGGSGALDILVAGCGTGQHAIQSALRFPQARVLAIDLSASSLAYARRKSDQLGLTSISYAQADLLELGGAARRFDLIECCGVLHHMADLWAGWRVLLSCLRPGGLMRIGLYSELARRQIVAVRALIAQRGLHGGADDIRALRQQLIDADPASALHAVVGMSDFYSVSACRDLLFHVQEHRTTLAEIDAFLRANGLAFIGFEMDADLRHAYLRAHLDDAAATDLRQWQAFEQARPDTFLSMYQFWVQAPGGQ